MVNKCLIYHDIYILNIDQIFSQIEIRDIPADTSKICWTLESCYGKGLEFLDGEHQIWRLEGQSKGCWSNPASPGKNSSIVCLCLGV